MAQIAREEKAQIKLKMIDILIEDPLISINRLSKRTGVCRSTAKIYRAELETKVDKIAADVTQKIEKMKEDQDSIWAKIKKSFGL